MSIQLSPEVRSFGADDHPDCPQCGKLMSLTRRGPNAELGASYERQTFTCECDFEVVRSADVEGRPALT